MTAALQSHPAPKRKSRPVKGGAYFVAIGSAVYRMDASTMFVKDIYACCPSEEKAKDMASRLCVGELGHAALRSQDAFMAEQFDGPHAHSLHPKAAANWRRVRAALEAFKRINGS